MGKDNDKEGLHIFGGKKVEHVVALSITASDEQDLMRIFREVPGLADVEVDSGQCDTIFRLEIGGKVVVNIKLKEKI